MNLREVTQKMTQEDLIGRRGVFYNPASASFKEFGYAESAGYELADAVIAEHGNEPAGMILFADCSKFAQFYPDMKSAIFWLAQ